jgi:hypothetical protein
VGRGSGQMGQCGLSPSLRVKVWNGPAHIDPDLAPAGPSTLLTATWPTLCPNVFVMKFNTRILEPSSNRAMQVSRFIEWHIVIINHVQVLKMESNRT